MLQLAGEKEVGVLICDLKKKKKHNHRGELTAYQPSAFAGRQ